MTNVSLFTISEVSEWKTNIFGTKRACHILNTMKNTALARYSLVHSMNAIYVHGIHLEYQARSR